MVEGKLQREGGVVHVIVKRCFDLSKLLRGLIAGEKEDPPLLTLSRADEKTHPITADHKKPQTPEPARKISSIGEGILNETPGNRPAD